MSNPIIEICTCASHFGIILIIMVIRRNRRIVVAVDFTRPDGPRRLEGLMRFLQSRRIHWDLRIKRSISECTSRDVDKFPAWDIDGVIYAHPQQTQESRDALEHLIAQRTPLVVLDPGDSLTPMPNRKDLAVVRTDPDSIGEISAHYFLSQGSCRSYGYVPDVLDRQWSQNRGKAFDKALREHGATCHIFKPSHPRQNDFSELVEWLESLPHPTGILAAYDDRALSVIEACTTANLSIPRDISLLSVDDDTFLCENCTPTLSSIRPDQERSGYAAGALMSSLLKDGCERPHVTTLPVKSISHRNSTLMASQSGRLVQKALAYVRRNFKRKISPDSIAAYLGVSRPLLDLRFRELLGTSASKTIDEERLKAVCDRLKTSNATLKEIAKDCGYADCFQLMHKFKQKFGITAATYRRSSHTSTPASIRETSL